MATAVIEKETKLPDKVPQQGKDDLLTLSHNQAHPGSAKPEDFKIDKSE
jgi:hypothetical protein